MEKLLYEYGVDGAALSTMRTGGKVARVCRPESEAEFIAALKQTDGPFTVLGNGSNVVFSSAGYGGTVLLTEGLNTLTETESGFICGAGLSLSAVAAHAANRGLSGLEFAYGIPGTVGGGIYMNAGAYGGEMKDVLKSVRCVSKSGEVINLSATEAGLAYRESVFMRGGLYILSAELVLEKGVPAEISAKMAENMTKRRTKQPLEFPSCGSVFKRPVGHFAGALIEECGLKGLTVGGAQVSEKHAGFIINRGGATGDDVIALIRRVQDTVFENTGVRLETEVKIY